jgi:hypothetical protein
MSDEKKIADAVFGAVKAYLDTRVTPLQQRELDLQAQIDGLAKRYEDLVIKVAELERKATAPALRSVA